MVPNCLLSSPKGVGMTIPGDRGFTDRVRPGGHDHDIVLVSMPFNVCVIPPIGICGLKTVLDEDGLRARVRHFNLEFLPFVSEDLDNAQEIHDEISYLWDFLPGEWLFSPMASVAEDRRFLDALRCEGGVRAPLVAALGALRSRTQAFIEYCAEQLAADQPGIVGFTSSFMQNQASLSLARTFKRLRPETKIVFGGSNAFGEMGRALIEQYDHIDLVVRSEAETVIVPLVRALLTSDECALRDLPGICFRAGGLIVDTPDSLAQIAMDEVPIPDFSDYFATLNALRRVYRGGGSLPHYLPIETSRGCWWGERSHCTFCGLNADRMRFRARSVEAAYDYIVEIQRRYGISRLFAVDNIIDHKYYDTLLERLAVSGCDYFIHYEIKSNLKRRHVDQLVRSGVHKVQPGIESLSTPLLKLMRKGVTALQNIQTLKWLTEAGIKTSWFLLYGFPGEDIACYREMAELIPKLNHIVPPGEIAPVYIERFSPYQSQPASFGIELTGPTQWYAFAFPEVPPERLNRLAYRFDFREPLRNRELDLLVEHELRPKIRAWKERFNAFGPTLHVVHGPQESLLVLGPLVRPERLIRVDGVLRSVLLAFDTAQPERVLWQDSEGAEGARRLTVDLALYRRFLSEARGERDPRGLSQDLDPSAALSILEARGLVVREAGAALTLPLVCDSTRLAQLLESQPKVMAHV
jgi:ribosomal peptide maturation radical SAM protein 1